MNVLLRRACIHQPDHPLHLQRSDIHIQEGLITAIGPDLRDDSAEVWEGDDLHVSAGWVDVGAHSMDPGQEHREDLSSLGRAAARGGYTHVAVFPNTEPVAHSKAEILYLQRLNASQAVRILPIGAISRHAEGEDIAELYDMHTAGAVAFSDGAHPVSKAGLLLRALLYVKAVDGVVIDPPMDPTLAGKGQIHEGVISTLLGMRGVPSLAETVQVYRDIQLLGYADSRMVLHAISARDSLDMIRTAKSDGLRLGATVPAWHLVFTDEAVSTYDTRFKLMPPLRETADRDALRAGLRDGTLDAIVSMHLPLEDDQKEVEFPYAAFGATGLETTFALCRSHLVPTEIDLDTLIQRLAVGPRRILNLPPASIDTGAPADLTVFQPDQKWTFTITGQASKGRNNPLDGQELTGKVFGVINNGRAIRTA